MARARRKEAKDSGGDVLEHLYAAAPEEFVAERNRLARSLKDEGRTAEAAEIAALKKPPLPVFLANRLARERGRKTEDLVGAAEQLTTAHQAGEAGKLLEAQSRLADALRELVEEAEQVAGGPVSESIEQRLAATLRAAAVDPRSASLLRRGVLPDEVAPAGFDALAGMSLPAPKTKGKPKGRQATRVADRAESARNVRVERIEDDLAEARDALRSAERAFGAAERELKRSQQRVGDLEARLEREQGRAG